MVQQQHTMDNVFGSDQTPNFTNNPIPRDTIEPLLSESVPKQKSEINFTLKVWPLCVVVPVDPPSKSCFQSINKGGVSLDSRKGSPDPLVLVDSSERNVRSHSFDQVKSVIF